VTTPTDLQLKMAQKIEGGRGMRLTADELDVLVLSGAYEALSRYCANQIAEQAAQRLLAKEQAAASSEPSFEARNRGTNPHPHQPPNMESLRKQAMRLSGKARRPRSTSKT
jgi:cytochrome c-type biogenesis protein CcmH/NrfG